MTLLTVEEYRSYSMGGETAPPGQDAEIYRTIEAATRLVNTAANGWLTYHTVADEEHRIRRDVNTGGLYFRLREKPVRQVQAMSLLAGRYSGNRISLGVDTLTDEPGALPVIQGDIVLNRNSSSVKVLGPIFLAFPPGMTNYFNAPVGITYTCGFDDGTPQADGISLPAPDWAKEAIRITTRKLMMEARRARAGRGFAGTYSLGDVSESYKVDIDGELPPHVQKMIEQNMQHFTLGAA